MAKDKQSAVQVKEPKAKEIKKVKPRIPFTKTKFYSNRYIHLMVFITTVFFLVFRYWPILWNVIAFQDFKILKGFSGSKFVGLKNFKEIFSNMPYFMRLLRNTIAMNGLNLLLGFPAPIIFALLLNELWGSKFKRTVQTISYLPHFISTVVVTITVLIFGEITPKLAAQINSEKIALRFSKAIYIVSIILKPTVFLLGLFTKYLTKKLSDGADDSDKVTEEDLKTIVDVGEEQGVINNEESEIINNVFDFAGSFASDIMTPRTNMEAIAIDATKEELDKFLIESKHSRIPVYGESIDNIVGVLHMKDIVTFVAEGREPRLKDMLRQTYYAYENMNIIDLFKSMKKMNVSLAIVAVSYTHLTLPTSDLV